MNDIIAAFVGGGLVALIGGFFRHKNTTADTYGINADTITKLSTQVDLLVSQRATDRGRIDELEERIDEMEQAAEIKDKYIERLEADNKKLNLKLNQVKMYVKNLLVTLRNRGIEFTEPAENLLDTDELNP